MSQKATGMSSRFFWRRLSPLLAGVLAFLLVDAAGANPLIEEARDAGILDTETALLYRVYNALDTQSLPADYRGARSLPAVTCGTPLVAEARAAQPGMSAKVVRSLTKVLARPQLQASTLTPSGHFRVHYTTSGVDAVDSTDDDANEIPDYIDLTASVLDSVWRLQIDELGYRLPPSDQGLGGGAEYDVYIQELGRSGKSTTALGP